jgi:hypothetical protein
MNRKTLLAFALSSAFTFPVSMAYADGDGTKEAPKPELTADAGDSFPQGSSPELIAQSDEKKEISKPELIAQSDEKKEISKPELIAQSDEKDDAKKPELVADKNEAPYPTQSEFELVG